MFVSMFDLKVEKVTIDEFGVTLRVSDGRGNNLTMFFKTEADARNFSKDVRRAIMDEAANKWDKFERPALITD